MIDAVGRIILSRLQLGIYALTPIPILIYLSLTDKISTRWKQIISLPLMTSLVYIPYKYCDEENGSFSVFCQIIPFIMFLRFLDIFWFTPIIYKKEAIIDISEFKIEFWSCIKKDLKPHREKTKQDTVKLYDKKFYHLFVPMISNVIAFDVLAAWVKTFTEQDILKMQKTSFLLSFTYLVVVVYALTCLLNFAGQMMQFLYCIFIDHGTYASSDWRLMMNYPLLSLSLEELWSHRWHRILRPSWVSSAYKPIYFLIRQWTNQSPKYKLLAIGIASMAVFIVSGLTHEYVMLCNMGWSIYIQHFIGDQMKFFCIHGVLVVLERIVTYFYIKVLKLPPMNSPLTRFLRHIYVISICYITFPYFLNGFAHWGIWKLDRITPIEQLVQDHILKPYIKQYCGSRL